jgi:type IV pilus assembly protein PilQ
MTVTNVQRQRPAARPLPLKAGLAGLMVGLCAALGSSAWAAPATTQQINQVAVDPAKTLPAAVSVSSIDFKRGDGGAGRLILHFSGDGAVPDLRTQGNSVLVDIGNAQLPASLQKPLDVTDFATPVQRIDAAQTGRGAQLQLSTRGQFESLAYQTGRDYIVEIVPRAAAPDSGRAVGAVSNTMAAGAQSALGTPHYSGRPVTFNFQDVPVRTVLQLIAEESGLNVVAADTVQGNVTLRLVNVPWDQALDLVLQAKGLDKRRSGNVVWVAPQAEIAKYEQDREDARINLENRAEMVTEYIPISYGNAEDLAKLLTDDAKNGTSGGGGSANAQRGFLSPRGSISFDRRTNTLLVIDIPQRVAAIRDLVQKLDKPVDQVVIEARIVIANESFARELGAKFGITGTQQNAYYSNSIANNIANQNSTTQADLANFTAQQTYNTAVQNYNTCLAGGGAGCVAPTPPTPTLATITRGLMSNLPSTLGSAGSLALSILNAGYALDIELSAMQTEGRGEIISNPRIVTSNQKEAVIRQGDQVGYLTTTGGQSGNIPQVQFKDVVLQLKVTPTITNDGRIFLNMDIQKDDLSGFVNTGAGQVPSIATREVTTAVLMDDGQTVVVGGVYEFKDQNSLAKVPFLADIPIIGNLFKNRNHTKSKAELLVFVTPKVIRVAQRPN